MIKPLRIGVTQRVENLKERSERRDAVDQAWTPYLQRIGCLPILIPNRLDDVANFVEQTGIDGLLLTGGNDLPGLPNATKCAPERDACEHALIEIAERKRIPLFGICRGGNVVGTWP